MASLKSVFGSAVAATAFWALTIPSASAQAGPTFACDPGFYQVISGQLAEFSPATACGLEAKNRCR